MTRQAVARSITDQRTLFEKIVEGAVYVTDGDAGWLLIREDRSKTFLLSAQRNLPVKIAEKVNQPWDDGISSLVALSGESLTIYGEPLERFKVAQLGKSALVVPIKIKKEVVGLLVVIRKTVRPFSPSNKSLLEAVADYASISMVNARLFRALEERARSLQKAAENAQASERGKDKVLKNIRDELRIPLTDAIKTIETLLVGENSRLNATQKTALRNTQDKLQKVSNILESLDRVAS